MINWWMQSSSKIKGKKSEEEKDTTCTWRYAIFESV